MNITEQWIVDMINANTLNKSTLQLKLANKEKELYESETYLNIKSIKEDLYKLEQHDLWIRSQWKQILIDNNIKKFESLDWTTIQLNKKAWVLKIQDLDNPELNNYKKDKITTTIDKKALKEDIKEWLIIEWVTIEHDYTLVIKHR